MIYPRFLAVDFFCGAGGTTRGLIDAGGYVIAGVDSDISCSNTYLANNCNEHLDRRVPSFLGCDLLPKTDTHPTGQQHHLMRLLRELINPVRTRYHSIPMLFSICAPCQPFTHLSHTSVSEKRHHIRKRDSSLLNESLKFVRRFRPELILSENVPGVSTSRYGNVGQHFQNALRQLGYQTASRNICASQFGVPQFRKRSILLGIRCNVTENGARISNHFQLTIPISDPRSKLLGVHDAIGIYPPIKAGDAHETVPNHRTSRLSKLNQLRLRSLMPGEPNTKLANTRFGDLSLDCHRRMLTRSGTQGFSDTYTRMSPNQPAPTITTHCNAISSGRFGHYDRSQIRGISLREAATLQSFPPEYRFFPEDQIVAVARMIGNAVPPRLAYYFASYLVEMYDTEFSRYTVLDKRGFIS